MQQISLNDNFIKVTGVDASGSYGGNQGWFVDSAFGNLSRQGCGVIAAVDTMLYLIGKNEAAIESYSKIVSDFCHERRLSRFFMKEISIRKYGNNSFAIGIIPIQMSGFINKRMKAYGIKKRFKWNGIHGHKDMYQKMKAMISMNNPVIWSLYSPKRMLKLYIRTDSADGFLYSGQSVNNHYVTATAILEGYVPEHPRMIEISSWGKRYYIDYDEYLKYVGKSLISGYCSNIFIVK